MNKAGTPRRPVRYRQYRQYIDTLRAGLLTVGTLTLTVTLEAIVLLTADDRARGAESIDAALLTAGLVVAPFVTAGLVSLVLTRSVLHYRQLLTETCYWVVGCDLAIAVVMLLAHQPAG
ncbi:hypothetical protein [Kineosporia sp. NBRC 101731]|uniref:hypothetical protein n=1 Tax=Kineosporia sp. NBRC 101731 TaxID=3032199 RepID=UPI0024A05C81|nr:hypothetical protein [Kineosporia sp. NBRC 101731]GLY33209.1 hypothetical protein Kisp02_65740 [Kineosporia sp. NBRC 101731]